MKKIYFLFCLLIYLFTISCNKVDMLGFIAPTGKTVEERFKESQSWNETKGEIIIHAKENYTFYDCSDIHVEKTIQNLSKFVDIVQNDTLAAFGFFDGDLINERGAFSTFYSVFKDNINYRPFLASVGNHDLYFEQWEDYVKYFNSSTYSFVIKTSSAKDFYIVLDTGSATIGSSQLKWLKNKLKERNDYRHCIIFTHTSFFLTDNSQTTTGSLALEETYELMNLFSENNVDLVISGHDHSYGIDNFNGVTYITTSLLKDDSETASYLKVNVDENLNFKNTKI